MPRDSNWTARVDVHLPALNLNAPEMLEIGLGVALQDHLDKTATLTLKRNATGWYFHAQSHGTGTADTNQTATNGAHASLRLRWDASNTLLYAEFDNNASDPHATWQPLHHWNLSANPTNWDLNNTSSFRIHLSGNSENLTVGNLQNIFADNFELASALPEITAHPAPASQTLAAGDTVTFSVTANNATAYQWQKNAVDISGATNPTYTLADINAAHAGTYRVITRNALGNTSSNNASLTVTPLVTAQPQSQTLSLIHISEPTRPY